MLGRILGNRYNWRGTGIYVVKNWDTVYKTSTSNRHNHHESHRISVGNIVVMSFHAVTMW